MTDRPSAPPAGRWAPAAVTAMTIVFAVAFSLWSVRRYDEFFAARFDLGNMTQAVWSAAQGDLFMSTGLGGEQFSRLGAHVEPILFAFAPLWRVWPSPTMLVVVQAIVVATAAVPAYLLARHWLGDRVLSVAFAAVVLLHPATQWATLFDFHPVTLAVPLLLWAVWAAATGRDLLLAITLVLALATKEHVGLAVGVFGVWVALSLGRRRAGALIGIGGLLWSVLAIGVIAPHYRGGATNALVSDRYGDLGDSPGAVLRTLVTRPWEALEIAASPDRAWYLLALLLPVLGLSVFAPLLAAAALPDLLVNLLSSRPEQHAIEYHYGAVIVPFLVAAAIRGGATLRTRLESRPPGPRAGAGALVAAALIAGYLLGPMPFWQHVPGGSQVRVEQLAANPRAATLHAAVALIPADAVVSAGNTVGGHLSARRRILTFPRIDDAEWVVIDLEAADVGDDVDRPEHDRLVAQLRRDQRFVAVFDRDGVVVLRRQPA